MKSILKKIQEKYHVILEPSSFMNKYLINNFIKTDKLIKNFTLLPIYDTFNNINIANMLIINNRPFYSIGAVPSSTDGEFRFYNIEMDIKSILIPSVMKLAQQHYIKYKNYISFEKSKIFKITPEHIVNAIALNYIIISFYVQFTEFDKSFKKYSDIYKIPKSVTDIERLGIYKVNSFNQLDVEGKNIKIKIGVKTIPLNINSIKHTAQLSDSFWCEVLTFKIVNRILNSFICCNFVYMYKWEITEVNNINIFANNSILIKYANSNKYLSNIKILNNNKISDQEPEIEIYNDKLDKLIEYAEKNIVYSNYMGLIFMELYGECLGSLYLTFIKNNTNTKFETVYNNIGKFRSMCFQVSYALACLNKFAKCIHGDLHLNNVLIRIVPEFNNAYIINDKVYIDKNNNVYSVIDFGRVILEPDLSRNIDTEAYNIHLKKLDSYLFKAMPDYYNTNRELIQKLLFSESDKLFNLLTALDMILFIRSFRLFNLNNTEYSISELSLDMELFLQQEIKDKIIQLSLKSLENINIKFIEKFYKSEKMPEKIQAVYDFHNELLPDTSHDLNLKLLKTIKKDK